MASIDPTADPYGYLGMTLNPDGSVARIPGFTIPSSAASSDPTDPVLVLSKDIPINQANNTWARLYLPRPEPATKLPLVVFYHGGGFVQCSAATTLFHTTCSDLANRIPALIVSVDYRLAPEHRLPAAYDDCEEALHWIRSGADEWLTSFADFSNCFLLGSSAGGNIAYHVGLRAAISADELKPLQIRGLVLHQPFFGGAERTQSEIRLANDKVLPLCVADLMWDLALPIGAERDGEFCNPIRAVKLEVLDRVRDLGWRFLVTASKGDPLMDRQVELVEMLREKGVDVVDKFREDEGCHGFEGFDESKANLLYGIVKDFVLAL